LSWLRKHDPYIKWSNMTMEISDDMNRKHQLREEEARIQQPQKAVTLPSVVTVEEPAESMVESYNLTRKAFAEFAKPSSSAQEPFASGARKTGMKEDSAEQPARTRFLDVETTRSSDVEMTDIPPENDTEIIDTVVEDSEDRSSEIYPQRSRNYNLRTKLQKTRKFDNSWE
ncbi:MAG: hypothetical protein M1834_000530, partial [Cirrosporium novae-zelandiae]